MTTIAAAGLTLSTPAKINLTLCIGRKRPDGYHDLESVFQAVGVYDQVTLAPLPEAEIRLSASDPALPTDNRNTAYRAAQLLRDQYAPGRGVHIHLEKRIPSEAGLGGGSSDAAAVLRGLNTLWNLRLATEQLLPPAAAVGSDVPFFLTGGCARVRGRGENVEPLSYLPRCSFALVKPGFGVSTGRAYADLAARRAGSPPPDCTAVTRAMLAALADSDSEALARALVNDLEAPVLVAYPEIGRVKDALLAAGARGALLSGSGATVFGVFPDAAAAEAGAARLAEDWPWVAVAPPVDGFVTP